MKQKRSKPRRLRRGEATADDLRQTLEMAENPKIVERMHLTGNDQGERAHTTLARRIQG
jgi:hypothetical protein